MIGIYKITNRINSKIYIGLSTNIEKRWIRHRNGPFNPNDKYYESPLYRSIRKHGIDNFIFEVLEECAISELNDREIYYIAMYHSDDPEKGYNRDPGGSSTRHGKLSLETVISIREELRTTNKSCKEIATALGLHENTILDINSGRTWALDGESYPVRSPLSHLKREPRVYFCQNCGKQIITNSKYCPECVHVLQQRAERPTPIKLAEMVKELGFEATGRQFGVSGKTISKWCKSYGIPDKLKNLINWYNEQMGMIPDPPKVKRKMSEISKPVNQIDKNTGQVLNTFKSASEAVRCIGKGRYDHILEVCKGKRQSACGYYWEFV